jgi:SAM-dependent methyltransferase
MLEPEQLADVPCVVQLKECHCGTPLKPLVTGPFFVRWHDGKRADLLTTLYYCTSCHLAIRGLDLSDPLVQTHYELADYTDPEKEELWREKRQVFFKWFCRLALKHLGRQPEAVLDFGCSYGHLLDMFAEDGAETLGVDVSPQMFDKIKHEGRHRIYRTIEDPGIGDNSVDLITAIDSIYCCVENEPANIFAAFSRKLKADGVIITRTTNRNQVFKAHAALWHLLHGQLGRPAPIRSRICGDAILNFSERSLLKSLEKSALKKVATYRLERKKKRRFEYLRDAIALGLYYMSMGQIDICPGLVLVVKKQVP